MIKLTVLVFSDMRYKGMISLRAKAEKANLNLSRINSISHKDDYIKGESKIDSYNFSVLS